MRVLGLLLFLTFIAVPRLHAANCGGATVCKCGDKVVQDYVMAADLGPCLLTHGLVIGNGVTLDGNGHQILGPGGAIETYGVYLNGSTGAVVTDVVVTGFLRGIRLANAQGNQILESETVQNGNFTTHVGYGIDMASGARNNLLQDNLIHNNADEGIHFGSGSGGNVFVGNTVYDNHIENIYFISSHNNTILNNTTRLGQTGVYVKDSTGNVFQDNTFQDKIVHIRGDSYNNQFINNTLLNTGFHFQVYTSDTPFRYPHDNVVKGGRITNASGICLRFSSSWDNVISDTILGGCKTDIVMNSDQAQSRNTVVNVGFSSSKVQLDGESALTVGWRLNLHVQDSDAKPLEAARVIATDANNRALFDVMTDRDGNAPSQTVISYVKTNATQTVFTPIALETKKNGFQTENRQVTLTNSAALTITLLPVELPSNSPPIAEAGDNQTVLLTDIVSFDGSRSSDPDCDPLTYTWNFGDGKTASGVSVSHTYKAAGVYTVMLTVSDGQLTSSDTMTVTVTSPSPSNSPPVADAGFDQTINVGRQLLLDGSGSMDPDKDPLSYSWDFGDGDMGSGIQVSHAYTVPGLYTATLTVTDGQLSTSDSVTITVIAAGEAGSIVDVFDRPDSSVLGNGWSEVFGNLVIDQQELRNAALKGTAIAVLPELMGSTQRAAADFVSVDNNPAPRFGIILRYQDPLNYYLLYRQAGGTSALRIAKVIDGKEKILASSSIANPTRNRFFHLSGAINGSTLTLEVDGTKRLVVSDATFPDGSPGISLGSSAAVSYRADNYSANVQ
jgi:parallel beta-helix repeat protein